MHVGLGLDDAFVLKFMEKINRLYMCIHTHVR